MAEPNKKVLPPTYFLVALVLEVALDFGLPVYTIIRAPWTYLGSIPVVFGIAVSIHGSRLFEQHGTTVKPFGPSSKLVVEGAFKYSRNPMYLGMVAILGGTAIGLGSLTQWLSAAGFVPIVTRRFILSEEASLRDTFGTEYEVYCESVRRWI